MRFGVKKAEDIIIKQELVPTKEKLDKEANKELFFREAFVQILVDNKDSSVIRLVDVMAKYRDILKSNGIDDKSTIQILKNVIGSNKDHTTSLIRDERVEWFYCKDIKDDVVEVSDNDRKPLPLPLQLERSRTKKYFAFYSSPIDDSSVLASIEAEKERQSSAVDRNKYDNYDFSNIPENKTDYAKKQADAQKLGKIGEEYILELERKTLNKERIKKTPIWVSEKNDSFGFDILSYRRNEQGKVKKVFIEVKTTSGDLYKEFYVSSLELEISKKYKEQYIIARVFHASDEKTINSSYFNGSFEDNDIFKKKEKGSVSVFCVNKK